MQRKNCIGTDMLLKIGGLCLVANSTIYIYTLKRASPRDQDDRFNGNYFN